MKRVLAFTFLLTFLPLAATAASKNSAHVELTSSVTVGTTDVPKGTYKVEWSGTYPNVQVTFTNGKWSKTFPAHIIEQRNDLVAQTTTAKGDKTILTAIQLHEATLTFGNGTQSGE
jgi:hypothetical protein